MGGMKSMVPTLYKNKVVNAPKLKTPEEGKALGAAMAEQKKDPAAFRKKYAKKKNSSMLDEEKATTLG